MHIIDSGADAARFAGTDAVAFRAGKRSQYPRPPAASDVYRTLKAA
ncbi:hypothetical protein AGRHK599_LOCUS4642 [Rhizobium rhizogenes]|uniref:Uncharacterized protein n=1 Tax=Rhizobium rhizogenes TaxID=359 RepID=A0AAN2DFT2_RHIRH|nr:MULTISPECIES: hypothetical protein [Rhizobium/Agrobacterium group]MCZ7441041.1 hypothetical protein [Rhizobium rhizogenes]NSZ82092.1 hypothetical protein [Agrobacterium tumefaciens]CAD0216379.1 hypothetical protein AGRHK599_LOCUS4642 [Rhizobium rhizogenes]